MRRVLLVALIVLPAAQPTYAQGAGWSYGRRDGVHLRILRDYELPAGATAQEPIVVVGGSAVIDGHAEDDVVVIGGSVRVGPTAVVRGDVFSAGGDMIIDPGARISGRVDTAVIAGPDFDIGIGRAAGGWWPAFAFGATVFRLAVVFAVALLLTIATPDWVRGISTRVASGPLGSAAIGLAGEVLFVPALVSVAFALVASVVGALLLLAFPFVLGAAALLWAAGYAAVAVTVGARLRGRRADAARPRIVDLAVGFAAISAVTIVAESLVLSPAIAGAGFWSLRTLGWAMEWVAWTVGLGAALIALLGPRLPAPAAMPLAAPAVIGRSADGL